MTQGGGAPNSAPQALISSQKGGLLEPPGYAPETITLATAACHLAITGSTEGIHCRQHNRGICGPSAVYFGINA